MLKTEGLVLESMRIGHMRPGCQAELPIVTICMVWMKASKVMHIIRPRSHKASKAKGFRGKARKNIKWMSRDDVGEVRYNSGRRWGHIPGLRGRVSIGRRRKSRGRVKT